jgi:hypothetical protein
MPENYFAIQFSLNIKHCPDFPLYPGPCFVDNGEDCGGIFR